MEIKITAKAYIYIQMFCLQQWNYRITENFGEEMINSYMLRHTLSSSSSMHVHSSVGCAVEKVQHSHCFLCISLANPKFFVRDNFSFFCNPDFLTQSQLNAHKNRVINKPFHSSFAQNGPFKCYPLESEQLYVTKRLNKWLSKK